MNIFDIKDKITIISGGMGQLGRQFCLSLLQEGARVAVFDQNIESDKIHEKFEGHEENPNLTFCNVDITEKASISEALNLVVEKWDVPHGFVNAAALDSPPNAPEEENGPFETYPEKSFDEVMDVNVKGNVLCCQIIGSAMAKAGRGSIINISSTYGVLSPDQRMYEYRRRRGSAFYKPVAYSVSKSAVLNLTRYLATYWATTGVRVNTLTFGGVFNHQDEEFLEEYCRRVPMGRMAREDEYNGAVIFLISDASSYMTGANLVIDGGWTAW